MFGENFDDHILARDLVEHLVLVTTPLVNVNHALSESARIPRLMFLHVGIGSYSEIPLFQPDFQLQ